MSEGSICGLEHFYDSRRCVLPTGHDIRSPWTPHQAADGFLWHRHGEIYAEGTEDEGVEEWDEPVEDLP